MGLLVLLAWGERGAAPLLPGLVGNDESPGVEVRAPAAGNPGGLPGRMIASDPEASHSQSSARLRGRLSLRAIPQCLVGAVDGKHALVFDEATGYFESPLLAAGKHRLLALVVMDDGIDVIDVQTELRAGEQRSLGDVLPKATTRARLRIEPVHADSGSRFDRVEIKRAGLSRSCASLGVADLELFAPIGKELVVRGLPAEGMSFRLTGAPTRLRLKSKTLHLRQDFYAKQVRPGATAVIGLEYARRVPLDVVVQLPPEEESTDSPEVELCLVDLRTGLEVSEACECYRPDGLAGAATAEGLLIAETGEHLLVARVVRRGRLLAFAARVVALAGMGGRITLQSAPVWLATGRAPRAQAGDRIEIGFAACPLKTLWQSRVGAGGRFECRGLPADQRLVMSVAGGPPQPIRSKLHGGRLQLSLEP